MYILSKQFCYKFNKLYSKSMNDNKIDTDEYNKLVKVYEDYRKNKKNKYLFKLKLLVFSYNSMFSINSISIRIYH